MDRFRAFLNLERGEEAPAFLLFLYLTLAMASYIVIKSASKGLYLSKYSFATLPYVYIGVAVLVGLVVSIYVRLSSRVSQVTLISGTLLFLMGNGVVLWWALRVQWPLVTVIYILWTGIFGVIVGTQVWTVANHVLDLRQAKRLFPLISSGGILGSAGGGLIGATLVKSVGTDNLVLVLVPTLLVSAAIVQVLMRRYGLASRGSQPEKRVGESKKGVRSVFDTISASPYLRLIVGLVALSAVVGLIINWQFDAIVQKSFRSKDQYTGFLASFQGSLSLFSFLVQVFVGSRLVEKLGVRVTLLMLPLALLGGTAVLILNPLRLWAGALLRGSDGALRYSLDKSTVELLYLPVPQSVKAEVKAVADMVVNRLADGVGSVLVLVINGVAGLSGVGLFNLVLISLWLWIALRTRREYVSTIRASLSDRPALPRSTLRMVFGDQGSVATLRSMLASKDEEVVLYSIELAVALGRTDWIPPSLTMHPSPKVRLKALEIVPLTEREILERVRAESNSTVRASAIVRACKVVRPGEPMSALQQFLETPDLKVRLSALVCVARQSSEGKGEEVKEFFDRIAGELDPASPQWKDVAEVLGEISHPAAVPLHLRLLQHPSPAVKRQAIISAGGAGHRELVPFLVQLLGEREWAGEARLALREYGPRILGTLADVLKDPAESIEVRRNIPLVLAYMPDQSTVALLLDSLFDYDGLLRYRAIRALGKLRVIEPDLRFDPEKVSLRIREECENTLWFRQALGALYPRDGSPDLLERLLKDKIHRGRDRVFRLLALLLPPSAACASLLALAEDDRLKKASVAEYLDNVLPGKLKDWVVPLVEPKASAWKPKQHVRTILDACLRSPDSILRDCAADAIAKHRWGEYSGSGTNVSVV